MIFLNLALPERTCYEPLASTHPDTQGIADWSQEDLFGVPLDALWDAQLTALRDRFDELRPLIPIVQRLAEDIDVTDITVLDDITPLCLPHTAYKSYSASHVDNGRFDRMTRWMDGLTAHKLSDVDASSCTSLETWLALLQNQTPIRMLTSSGTSGKMSFFPRSEFEENCHMHWHFTQHGPYRDEADSELITGEHHYFSPWTVGTGHHNITTLFRLLRERVYAGREDRMHILGQGHWDTDMIWLSGRTAAAAARGEAGTVGLTPAMRELQARLVAQQKQVDERLDVFLDELFVDTVDQRIIMFSPYPVLIPLAEAAAKRGLKAQFTDDSYIVAGQKSGSKGKAYPDGWYELCKSVVPQEHQAVYGMTEISGSARLCSAGNSHHPPWIVQFLLDPDTSMPLPREGVQTGRFAVFDLWPRTYWPGSITGDRVTIDWRGGCACGRTAAIVDADISRYSNLHDDDKISCAKSPDAYDRAIELTLSIA